MKGQLSHIETQHSRNYQNLTIRLYLPPNHSNLLKKNIMETFDSESFNLNYLSWQIAIKKICRSILILQRDDIIICMLIKY